MQNEAQYDLDRKAAKMSALSSKNLDKYEYLIFPIFMINIKGFLSILPIKKTTVLTTKYFHLKLMILIFMIDIIHCTII